MRIYDAHNHLQDPRFDEHREIICKNIAEENIRGCVVNGTKEQDWNTVKELATDLEIVCPSFGLHPWFISKRTENWKDSLLNFIDSTPGASIGEIGLDKWIDGFDIEDQQEVFLFQLTLAAERNFPASIHCLKAWGLMLELLKNSKLPKRGFLLHAYGGPIEMLDQFLDLGAYFSFNSYFARSNKSKQQEVFKRIPDNRLLVESDAPDMLPEPNLIAYPLEDNINHPANLINSYNYLSDLRGVELKDLCDSVEQNFTNLFLR